MASSLLPEDGLVFIDAAKLNASSKRGAHGIRYTAPYVLGALGPVVELDSFLIDASRHRVLLWAVDNRPVANGRLELKCAPPANHVAVHSIVVCEGQGACDRFTLVVIPSSTASAFKEWVRIERTDLSWVQALPPVYSSLLPGGLNPEPDHCNPKFWPSLRKVAVNYHPSAVYEMRSVPQPNGSGHQATYDAAGRLLRHGTPAGTADRGSPVGYNPFRLIAHRNQDVLPFIWAAQLDGNPVNPRTFYIDLDAPILNEGKHLAAYMSVRPAFNPLRREIPAGVCIGPAP